MSNDDLIRLAVSTLRPKLVWDRQFGDVAAALLSRAGKTYTGVSIDTPGWGICAERNALAAMVTAGEYTFEKIVAVWKNTHEDNFYVLPPCGACREFMRSIDQGNLQAEIVLGRDRSEILAVLLPFHQWPEPIQART